MLAPGGARELRALSSLFYYKKKGWDGSLNSLHLYAPNEMMSLDKEPSSHGDHLVRQELPSSAQDLVKLLLLLVFL